MSNKVTRLYHTQNQQNEPAVIAKVIEVKDGAAIQVDRSGEQLAIVGHFAEVPVLRVGDRVAVMVTGEGGIIMSRLRNPGEKPQPLVVNQDGRLQIEASRGICLKAGQSRIEITADGRIWIDGSEIYSISEGRMRLQGSTIELN